MPQEGCLREGGGASTNAKDCFFKHCIRQQTEFELPIISPHSIYPPTEFFIHNTEGSHIRFTCSFRHCYYATALFPSRVPLSFPPRRNQTSFLLVFFAHIGRGPQTLVGWVVVGQTPLKKRALKTRPGHDLVTITPATRLFLVQYYIHLPPGSHTAPLGFFHFLFFAVISPPPNQLIPLQSDKYCQFSTALHKMFQLEIRLRQICIKYMYPAKWWISVIFDALIHSDIYFMQATKILVPRKAPFLA